MFKLQLPILYNWKHLLTRNPIQLKKHVYDCSGRILLTPLPLNKKKNYVRTKQNGKQMFYSLLNPLPLNKKKLCWNLTKWKEIFLSMVEAFNWSIIQFIYHLSVRPSFTPYTLKMGRSNLLKTFASKILKMFLKWHCLL